MYFIQTDMKDCRINLRLSERRMKKLKEVAEDTERTITQMFEEFIDNLPNKKTSTESTK